MIKSWLERSHEAKHILSVDKFLVDSPDLKVGPNLVLILSKIRARTTAYRCPGNAQCLTKGVSR